MANRYVIGDLHFGDPNIVRFERPYFKNVDEMNRTFLANWNDEILADDLVYVLGDFFDFTHISEEDAQQILNQLLGNIILIAGNHDVGHLNFFRKNGIEVIEYPILVDDFWILSHEPKYVTVNAPYANIFAHVHTNPMYKDVSSRSFCVSAERIGNKPIRLEKVFEMVKKLA